MRSYFSKLICLLGLVLSISAQAQMTITFPVERIVFQRDNNNRATVQIAGNYYQPVDKIEAKLTPLNGGNGIDWTALSSISNGFFRVHFPSPAAGINLKYAAHWLDR
ncbi:hypothetical protein BWI93_08300 [Siphonobacter sp. BAB-5385]|uniref:hypothetical protein n=1 Tax=Siphonobacter sp. BAB-5385 TaxID=1864822 RepID=UPI000BD5CF83|nr:hypothetical protein [Siphonobacter sp. BAB-5385]OZI08618.1 hypothetical protein BWI93_08300 [Siphonobacter sp. BAB-5385]